MVTFCYSGWIYIKFAAQAPISYTISKVVPSRLNREGIKKSDWMVSWAQQNDHTVTSLYLSLFPQCFLPGEHGWLPDRQVEVFSKNRKDMSCQNPTWRPNQDYTMRFFEASLSHFLSINKGYNGGRRYRLPYNWVEATFKVAILFINWGEKFVSYAPQNSIFFQWLFDGLFFSRF